MPLSPTVCAHSATRRYTVRAIGAASLTECNGPDGMLLAIPRNVSVVGFQRNRRQLIGLQRASSEHCDGRRNTRTSRP